MSEPIYNTAVKAYQYLPTTPPKNKEFYVVDEDFAEKAFANWEDITKTTNAKNFERFRRKNQRILKFVYGGNGTSAELKSTGYTEKYGPVTYGGVAVKDEDVQITPGTKAYFEFTHYNGQPKKQREEYFEKKNRIEERNKIKEKEKKEEINEEIAEFEKEANEIKDQRDIAVATGKPEISKVLKDQALGGDSTGIEIGTSLSEDDDDDILKNTSLNEEDLKGTGARNQINTETVIAPVTTKKPDPKTKVPPIIINHAECGHLTFGEEKDGETERPRDVGLYAGDSNALRLFRDGGFELRSSESAGENKIRGSSIMQVCNNATLLINSEGDVTIRARNKLRLVADLVEIEAKNASTEGVTIIAEHDINLRANNNTIITSDNITIDAKERIVSHSEGWQILIGQYIRLHEPQTKICPSFLKEYIKGQIKTLRN